MGVSFTALEVKKKLKKYDSRFEFHKGARHRTIIFHPDFVNGRACPLPEHGKQSIGKGILGSISRRFDLPVDFWESKK